MRIKVAFYFTVLVFLCALFVHPAFSEDQSPKNSSLEQSKAQVLEDIEVLTEGLQKTKECVSGAKTSTEFEQCREAAKIRKFQEVQDMLFEVGMSREERRMKRFPEK